MWINEAYRKQGLGSKLLKEIERIAFEVGQIEKDDWYRFALVLTEAMKQIVSFAMEQLGIKEIVGRYAKENPASGKVMEKLGFQFEKEILYECNKGTVLREGIQCRLVL